MSRKLLTGRRRRQSFNVHCLAAPVHTLDQHGHTHATHFSLVKSTHAVSATELSSDKTSSWHRKANSCHSEVAGSDQLGSDSDSTSQMLPDTDS